MSVITAVNFVFFGLGALAAKRHGSSWERCFVACDVLGLLIAFLALLGYAYDAPLLYHPLPSTSIAVHTAAAGATMFVGLAATRPDLGWFGLARSGGAGGRLARHLLPIVVFVPPVLGWLRLKGEEAGFYDARLGLALFAVSNVAVLTAVAWLASRRADRLDAEREATLRALAASEERLRASEQRHRQVVELIQEAIWIHHDGTIVFANPAAAKLFGADGVEVLHGRSTYSLLHPDDRERAIERTRTITNEGRGVPVAEMRLVGLDGRTRTAVIHALPFMQNGQIHVLVAGRDVTGLREAEGQLRQAQKMESVGQLTGGVAHDFNNLLTVIIGGLDLALGRAPAEISPLIESSLKAAERGAALVARMLAFSRRQTLIPESLAFNQLVTGMEDLLRRTLGADVEIEMKLGRELWPALADKGQVENALLNLAINARDAMPDGGKLTIETGNIHLDEDYAAHNAEVTPGDYAMLAVTDTGSGMPPEVVQRAFEPFFTTKGVGKGTGLGLSMIYGFAKQSGGHLKIYSEVGHGTTIRLYLPRIAAAGVVAAAPQPVQDEQPRGGETILVVEDDADVRALVAGQLRDLGYQVIQATDGHSAKKTLDSDQSIDLLFTDVVMPGGMTGRQLAEDAMRRRPRLKTLFSSGCTENSILHQGKLDPGVHFLPKPFRRRELALKIRQALGA